MQHQYVGDIGDYIKYALLRAIMEAMPESKKKLGVAWYRTPDDGGGDGRHINYLRDAKKWACLDRELFGVLRDIVCVKNNRDIGAIEESGILGDKTVFYSDILCKHCSKPSNEEFRLEWFQKLKANEDIQKCDVIFADPDKGFCNDGKFKWENKDEWKRLPFGEAVELAKDRIGIFYHHNGQHKPHFEQIDEWRGQLESCLDVKVMALYWRAWANRTFFVTIPSKKTDEVEKIKEAMVKLAERAEEAKLLNYKKECVIKLYGIDSWNESASGD